MSSIKPCKNAFKFLKKGNELLKIETKYDIKNDEKKALLSNWRNKYRLALESGSFEDSINKDVPILLAGFTEVVKNLNEILNSNNDDSELEII